MSCIPLHFTSYHTWTATMTYFRLCQLSAQLSVSSSASARLYQHSTAVSRIQRNNSIVDSFNLGTSGLYGQTTAGIWDCGHGFVSTTSHGNTAGSVVHRTGSGPSLHTTFCIHTASPVRPYASANDNAACLDVVIVTTGWIISLTLSLALQCVQHCSHACH